MDFEVKDTSNGVHFFGACPLDSPIVDHLLRFFHRVGGERLAMACMSPARNDSGDEVVLVSGYDHML